MDKAAEISKILRRMKETAVSGDEVMCAAELHEAAAEIAALCGIDLGDGDDEDGDGYPPY